VDVGGSERTVACSGPALPEGGLGPMERNLAFRAAEAYLQAAEWRTGFRIEIEKHVPVGGGLGGGSADAAAVLRALAALAPVDPARVKLPEIAFALGSDVPFLARADALALAWGRGERLLPLPALPRRHVALLQPAFGVRTAEAYGWLASARAGGPAASPREVVPLDGLGSWARIAAAADNDFEAAVERRHPELAGLRRALEDRGAILARLSGSGSTVFGVFDEAPDAGELERATGCRVLLTHTAERVVPVQTPG
jgi:4-diphosphocytidyl-2-C-methyl-D-erythritol kinase